MYKGGVLRGCIGTIAPACRNIAEEIIQNAVSAGIHDPRFPSVRREELSFLEYTCKTTIIIYFLVTKLKLRIVQGINSA